MITYAAKQQLLTHLSAQAIWKSTYDDAFFRAAEQRTRSISRSGFNFEILKSETQNDIILVRHGSTRVQLEITKLSDGHFQVIDERGMTTTSRQNYDEKIDRGRLTGPFKDVANTGHNLQKPSPDTLEIQRWGIIIRAFNNGEKEIIFDGHGTKAQLKPISDDTPARSYDADQIGNRLHMASIGYDMLEAIGIKPADAPPYLALFIARDLGLQTDLKARNKFNEDVTAHALMDVTSPQYDMDWDGPEQWRPKVESDLSNVVLTEQSWNDVVEFEGVNVETPNHFSIIRRARQFFITACSDKKDRILNCGLVFKSVVETSPTTTPFITPDTPPQKILDYLSGANSVEDRSGTHWHYLVVESPEAGKVAFDIKGKMDVAYGLDGNDFVAMNYERGLSFIAVRRNNLERKLGQTPNNQAPELAIKQNGIIDPALVV